MPWALPKDPKRQGHQKGPHPVAYWTQPAQWVLLVTWPPHLPVPVPSRLPTRASQWSKSLRQAPKLSWTYSPEPNWIQGWSIVYGSWIIWAVTRNDFSAQLRRLHNPICTWSLQLMVYNGRQEALRRGRYRGPSWDKMKQLSKAHPKMGRHLLRPGVGSKVEW